MALVRRLSVVFLFVCAVSVQAREFEKPEPLRALRARKPFTTAQGAKTVAVDCTKGKKVQDAIDGNPGPLTIDIHGICMENVRVHARTDLTLRGVNATTDGIQGTDPDRIAGLEIYHSTRVLIQNLSFSNSVTVGLGVWFSHVELENCQANNNANTGLHLSSDSGVNAFDMTVSNNTPRGTTVQRAATFFCVRCTYSGNTNVAAVATTGGLFSLLDSVITGTGGISANAIGAYADVDCISEPAPDPCSINVTNFAVSAIDGEAALYATGDFTGRVRALEHGRVLLYGARQQPGTGSGPNGAGNFSSILLEPDLDSVPIVPSRLLRPTNVDGFSRLLVREPANIDGNVNCNAAGDAWLDPTVVKGVGVTVTNCEHAP